MTQSQKQEIISAIAAKYPGAKTQFKTRTLSNSDTTYIHIGNFPNPTEVHRLKDPRFIILSIIQEYLPQANMISCGLKDMTVAEF